MSERLTISTVQFPCPASVLGSITLAEGTDIITDLSSSATLIDEGWGGQGFGNGVNVRLEKNGAALWTAAVAEATHSWSSQTYDVTSDPSALAALNTALDGVDWSSAPTVTMTMFTTGRLARLGVAYQQRLVHCDERGSLSPVLSGCSDSL